MSLQISLVILSIVPIAFTEKNFESKVPHSGTLSSLDTEMILKIKDTPGIVGQFYEQYRFRDGLMETMNFARSANKYFNDSEPWKTKKSNSDQCAATLYVSLQVVRTLAILLAPVIPSTAERIWKLLKTDSALYQDGWDSAAYILLEPGRILGKPEILIQKIEDIRIEEIGKFLEGDNAENPKPDIAPIKPSITIDDFAKIDLRIAKVLKAERVPKSEKLLKLQVELGSEQRQILAGIAKKYVPEELIGKLVVIVANLQPAQLMGQESQGMILAASDTNGNMKFIEPTVKFRLVRPSNKRGSLKRIKSITDFVKIEHTLFSLPLIFAGVFFSFPKTAAVETDRAHSHRSFRSADNCPGLLIALSIGILTNAIHAQPTGNCQAEECLLAEPLLFLLEALAYMN